MIGQSIGSYRIVAKLGEGGMGVVYLGEHQRITRSAAIKVLLPEYSAVPDVLSRFFNEAKATSAIQHPGIVEIIDCDVLPDGSAFIVMEQLKGDTLGGLLRRRERFTVQRAVLLARHIADALAAAHEKQIVHRDLKPDNVFVLEGGSQPTKILDFGIAKLMDRRAGEGHHMTRTGIILGTPLYMAPEQCRGASDVGYQTDIYALGCILFEMICGRPPFTGTGFGEVIHSHIAVAPPTLRSIDATLPAALDDLVARMLAKAPGDRPPMRAVTAELDQILGAAPARSPDLAAPALPPDGAAPAESAGRQVRTMLLPQNQAINTTLGSASSERMDAVDADQAPEVPSRPRRGPLVGLATGAVLLVGVGIWLVARPGTPVEPEGKARKTPAAVEPDRSPPPAASPSAPDDDDRAAPRAGEVVPRKTERPAPLPTPPRPLAAEKVKSEKAGKSGGGDHVKVVITSEPAGADVCFAKDLALLGKTRLEWRTEKSSTPTKLLVRMSGYRGQEISIVADHERKTSVKLHPLGPDDPADVDNCARAR